MMTTEVSVDFNSTNIPVSSSFMEEASSMLAYRIGKSLYYLSFTSLNMLDSINRFNQMGINTSKCLLGDV